MIPALRPEQTLLSVLEVGRVRYLSQRLLAAVALNSRRQRKYLRALSLVTSAKGYCDLQSIELGRSGQHRCVALLLHADAPGVVCQREA